jgi:hypothetical protein
MQERVDHKWPNDKFLGVPGLGIDVPGAMPMLRVWRLKIQPRWGSRPKPTLIINQNLQNSENLELHTFLSRGIRVFFLLLLVLANNHKERFAELLCLVAHREDLDDTLVRQIIELLLKKYILKMGRHLKGIGRAPPSAQWY